MVRNQLSEQVENFLSQNRDISLVLSILKHNSGKTNNKFITSPVISYRRFQKESDDLSYTVRSFVMVRNQLPAQVVEQWRVLANGERKK